VETGAGDEGRTPPGVALWRRVAGATPGSDHALRYAARFDALAAQGEDVHGEARFVSGLLAPGARVLDAGCGTGRVGQRLADLGYQVTGVDADPAMVEVARRRAPDVPWHTACLEDLPRSWAPRRLDAVVLAGNVVPFLDPADLPRVLGRLADLLGPGGLVVSGFGLDPAHLPPGVPVVPFDVFDSAARSAGLRLEARLGGWAGEPASSAYVVSVHRKAEPAAPSAPGAEDDPF